MFNWITWLGAGSLVVEVLALGWTPSECAGWRLCSASGSTWQLNCASLHMPQVAMEKAPVLILPDDKAEDVEATTEAEREAKQLQQMAVMLHNEQG